MVDLRDDIAALEARAKWLQSNASWLRLRAHVQAPPAAVVQWPKADDSAKKLGWSWDYKWLESLADATRAAGWDASMEAIDFVLSQVAAPPAAVPSFSEQIAAEAKTADRTAIRLLVAAGFITEEKANEALCIAHGFSEGPLAPPAAVPADTHGDEFGRGWNACRDAMLAAERKGE